MYYVSNNASGEDRLCDSLDQVEAFIKDESENDSSVEADDFHIYKESHSVRVKRTFKVELVAIK